MALQLLNHTGLTAHLRDATDDAAPMLILKGSFALAPGKPCTPLPPDAQRPIEGDAPHMDALGRSLRWPSDLAPPKPHTDLLVVGSTHAPGGVALPSWEAGFDCGPLSRRVAVFGPRNWTAEGSPGLAQPAASVPLRWELAFGGMNDPRNLFGRGIDADESGRVPMPQVERREALLRQRADRPEPANLGPVPSFFPARQRLAGTRDQRWSLFRAPLPPDDYDPAFHNAAPIEQQAGNHPRGDEALTLHALHPEHPVLRTALPGLRPRAVLLRGEAAPEEVPLVLDTVVILTEEVELVLVWRVVIPRPVPEFLLLALEPLGAATPLETLAAPALAAREAARPPDPAVAQARKAERVAAGAQAEAEGMATIDGLLKGIDLPPQLRALIGPGKDPMALAAALISHLETEVARLPPPPGS